ncbi:hypothetical protein ACIOG8_31530 [Streptomyces erythrochromogenes]|uniref:hypothetical protein n=1 Tax=Streptomyces erythrochromogenes TaxID=285574 RepID=UPI003805CB54
MTAPLKRPLRVSGGSSSPPSSTMAASKERFDAEFAKVIKGSDIEPSTPPATLRDDREAADHGQVRKLITALVGHP